MPEIMKLCKNYLYKVRILGATFELYAIGSDINNQNGILDVTLNNIRQ